MCTEVRPYGDVRDQAKTRSAKSGSDVSRVYAPSINTIIRLVECFKMLNEPEPRPWGSRLRTYVRTDYSLRTYEVRMVIPPTGKGALGRRANQFSESTWTSDEYLTEQPSQPSQQPTLVRESWLPIYRTGTSTSTGLKDNVYQQSCGRNRQLRGCCSLQGTVLHRWAAYDGLWAGAAARRRQPGGVSLATSSASADPGVYGAACEVDDQRLEFAPDRRWDSRWRCLVTGPRCRLL